MILIEKIKYVLNNEQAGPNLEELLGIAYSLGVGVGLFAVGGAMKSWLQSASTSIHAIKSTVPT